MIALKNESLYLAYRRFFPLKPRSTVEVSSAAEMESYIRGRIDQIRGRIGIMLSGGMDSAALARFLPPGSIAYTLDYGSAYPHLSEFDEAARYVPSGVEHKRVHVTRTHFFQGVSELTKLKREPTVPHDATFWIASQQARADGITHMVTGIGADGRFGGFAHFYENPTVDNLKKKLNKQFVAPWKVLRKPEPTDWVLQAYTRDGIVDVQRFLSEVGTEGTAISDSLKATGLEPCNFYSEMRYGRPLPTSEGAKAPLRELFALAHPGMQPNKKVPLPAPYGDWLADYRPKRGEFHSKYIDEFGGKRRYQVFALELYMNMREEHGWSTPDVAT